MPMDQPNNMPATDKDMFSTENVPTLYCNHAAVSLSHTDVRLYLGEISPREMAINPTGSTPSERTPRLDAKICLAMSPEFAQLLLTALSSSVERYQSVFGPLRPPLTPDQLKQATEKK